MNKFIKLIKATISKINTCFGIFIPFIISSILLFSSSTTTTKILFIIIFLISAILLLMWLIIGCYNEIIIRKVLKSDKYTTSLLLNICENKTLLDDTDASVVLKLTEYNAIKKINNDKYSLTWWAYLLVSRISRKKLKQ
jgi:hypothetical protein